MRRTIRPEHSAAAAAFACTYRSARCPRWCLVRRLWKGVNASSLAAARGRRACCGKIANNCVHAAAAVFNTVPSNWIKHNNYTTQ